MERNNVILFPISRRRGHERTPFVSFGRYKLSPKDKIDIFHWEARGGSSRISRIALHEDSGDSEETADVVLIYGSVGPDGRPWGGSFAQLGLARQDSSILLWRCSDGADLGLFADILQALQAAERQIVTLLGDETPIPPLRIVLNS